MGRRRRHDRQALRAARRAIEGGDVVGLTVRSMVTVDGGDAAASTSTGHEAYSSAPAPTEPATPEAATRNPDDEYTQPDGSRIAPVQVVLSGRVASSSGGQQAQCEQVRLSMPHGRLTSRPPLRHRHHRSHCQPHHVAALGGAARVKPPTTILWATSTTTLTTATKPLSLVVA